MSTVTRFVILFVISSIFVLIRGHPAPSPDEHKIVNGDITIESNEKSKGNNEPVIVLDTTSPDENNAKLGFSQMDQFLASLGIALASISNRMTNVFKHFPAPRFGVLPDDDVGNKTNSTSVTKIINGHKVTINDTDYKNESKHGSAYYHVRIVDVHPDQENLSKSKEIDNSIPQNTENEALFLDSYSPLKIQKRKDTEWSSEEEWENSNENDVEPLDLQNLETFDEVDYQHQPQGPLKDLSNDIYVNEVLANSGAPINPDAEYIPNRDEKIMPPVLMKKTSNLEDFSSFPYYKNNYYHYDFEKAPYMKPIDMSNDIYVNEIMENSASPAINPYAEMIDFNSYRRQPRSFRHFFRRT